MHRVARTHFLCLWKHIDVQGCGYGYAILENEDMNLLFQKKRENDFIILQVENMILLKETALAFSVLTRIACFAVSWL